MEASLKSNNRLGNANNQSPLTNTHLPPKEPEDGSTLASESETNKIIKHTNPSIMKTQNSNSRTNFKRPLSTALIATSLFCLLTTTGCKEEKLTPPTVISRDQVFQSSLYDVRLGDGIPLDVELSVRWKIEDYQKFSLQFESPDHYDSLILAPRQHELANKVSNTYHNVDSVFTIQRHQFINELKSYMKQHLGEEGIQIKEVIVSELKFPSSYTSSREVLATQEQELERIRRQSIIDLENRNAAKEQAEAQGKVDMAKAEMEAKVQKIKAETEKSIRASRLAKAETEKQVSKLQAIAESERQELMAKADLKKREGLKDLEIQKQKELNLIALEKQKQQEAIVFNKDLQMAKLCTENPAYANYMVNKELASKVQIAVLPSSQDASVFNNLLNNSMTSK